uniref:Transmembrane protein 180 n=1 Tax=Heligmosomoides polygyrus TaxID=6339 RepID=A0A8L8JT84_HELPZ
LSPDNPLIAIACGQFSLSLMQAMFMFYYVKIYMNVFHVPHVWFNIAQTLFMFWNAINDPLFGYLQDKPGSWMNSRTRVIRSFAPFLVVSFIFMWVPWLEGTALEGVHLTIFACCLPPFHNFFSAIGVAWGALFADSTKEPRLRVSAMKYSQISILLSVNIIAITEKLSHSLERFWAFQLITVFVAFIALFCFMVAGSLRPTLPHSVERGSLLSDVDDEQTPPKGKEVGSMWVAMQEICFERDFVAIIATNFIHIARSVAHMNFASTATELLIPQTILPKGSFQLSLFYGVLTLGPQILLILCERVVVGNGAYRVLMTSYAVSVISGLVFFFSTNPYLIMVFMLIDSITVHSAAPLFNIVISDFIDDDAKRHSRRSGLSSLVFSLNALFTKPAQSIAPVLVIYILSGYGYDEYIATKQPSDQLANGMRLVLLATPIILGGLQYYVFRSYSLRNKHVLKPEEDI